tara:strand:- start:11232 stop:12086 length:855 start_codon:yes stop_codon:yes gene_type:complete
MKKIFLLVLPLLLFSSIVAAQSLYVTMVNQDPDPVRAGEVVEVRFKIENLWTTTEENVLLEIQPEYPFTLYSGDALRELGIIVGRSDFKEATIVDFKLKVDSNAVDGDHAVKLKLTKGSAEWTYDDDFYIDIEKEEINLKAYVRSSELITSGNKGAITLELANAGESDIKFLELELLPSQDYKLLSTSNYVYLGDLDSDDTESEDFEIYVNKEISTVHLPIKVEYEVRDTNYKKTYNLELNLLTEKEATKLGLIKKNNLNTILITIAVILIGIYTYRKIKKRKQ